MNVSTTARSFVYSSKRHTTWSGMQVGFNKAKTVFFKLPAVILEGDTAHRDSNGGWTVQGWALELSEIEAAELLNTWRHGKQEWYRENAALPLRPKAEHAKAIAISNPA